MAQYLSVTLPTVRVFLWQSEFGVNSKDSLAQLAPMLSSNSSSSSSSRSTGGEWTGELYFYPDMDDDNKDVSEHVVTNAELNRFKRNKTKETRLEKLFGKDKDIELVRVYSNPLNSIQVTKVAPHRAFVLFKLLNRNTWWSIE